MTVMIYIYSGNTEIKNKNYMQPMTQYENITI